MVQVVEQPCIVVNGTINKVKTFAFYTFSYFPFICPLIIENKKKNTQRTYMSMNHFKYKILRPKSYLIKNKQAYYSAVTTNFKFLLLMAYKN